MIGGKHQCFVLSVNSMACGKCGFGVAPSCGEDKSKSFMLAHKRGCICGLLVRFFLILQQGCKNVKKAASYTWGDRLQSSGSVIRNAWESADNGWYNASSVNFYYYSSSVNVLNSFYESSSSLYGRTTISHSGGIVTSFVANVNAGNSNIMQNNVARSTANHEFGHVLGIDDPTSGKAIMNVNRNRGNVYVPKTDDKNGITAIYG